MKNSITGLYSTNNPNLGMGTGDKVVVDTRNGWATRGFLGVSIMTTTVAICWN